MVGVAVAVGTVGTRVAVGGVSVISKKVVGVGDAFGSSVGVGVSVSVGVSVAVPVAVSVDVAVAVSVAVGPSGSVVGVSVGVSVLVAVAVSVGVGVANRLSQSSTIGNPAVGEPPPSAAVACPLSVLASA